MTHFLDGSQIYSSYLERFDFLKAKKYGKLKTVDVNGSQFPPLCKTNVSEFGTFPECSMKGTAFIAGIKTPITDYLIY